MRRYVFLISLFPDMKELEIGVDALETFNNEISDRDLHAYVSKLRTYKYPHRDMRYLFAGLIGRRGVVLRVRWENFVVDGYQTIWPEFYDYFSGEIRGEMRAAYLEVIKQVIGFTDTTTGERIIGEDIVEVVS
jgi:hypothetical protein